MDAGRPALDEGDQPMIAVAGAVLAGVIACAASAIYTETQRPPHRARMIWNGLDVVFGLLVGIMAYAIFNLM